MVEMIFESGLVTPLIQTKFREQVENTKVDIIKIRKPPENKNHPPDLGLTLADLDEMDVFSRCLDENKIPEEERKDLVDAYREILSSVHEEDMSGPLRSSDEDKTTAIQEPELPRW